MARKNPTKAERESDPLWAYCKEYGCGNKAKHRNGTICGSCVNRKCKKKNPRLAQINSALYYIDKREQILEYQKGYRDANREALRERNRNYYWLNRERIIEGHRKRRLAKKEQSERGPE